jgi:hypothetical protein
MWNLKEKYCVDSWIEMAQDQIQLLALEYWQVLNPWAVTPKSYYVDNLRNLSCNSSEYRASRLKICVQDVLYD